MQKLISLTILYILLSFSNLHASNPIDSIGVENLNGKKVIIHKIVSQETYYALGRKYNVAPKDIISFNENRSLVPGIIVKVPTQIDFTSSANVASQTLSVASEHTVKAKENLSIISNLYGTTVQEIKNLNNLSSNNLSIGQKLKIPGRNVASSTTPTVNQPIANQPIANQPTYTSPVGSQVATTPANASAQARPNNTSAASTEVLEHTVKAKEFLGKIATEYNTTVEAIKLANNLSSNNLRIGQILKIPGRFDTAPTTTEVEATGNHTVKAGETIFNIAQRYSLTAFQVREANNLTDNNIAIGQILKIPGNGAVRSIQEVANSTVTQFPDTVETIQDPTMRREPGVYGLNQVEEKGTAVWIDDPDLDSTKMLVLHRTLPIGTVIMVKNPMGNISTFAKVVGKFTENETTKDVIIVVTKAVAEKLGVHDKRFFCNITYATHENGQ